jgi:hypothetical protein
MEDRKTMIALADTRSAFTEIMNDEKSHVTFFQTALTQAGTTPRPKPTFKGLEQTSLSDFAALSRVFENIGVGAFLMAMPAISNKDYTAAAGGILTIEARHAGFIDFVLRQPLSENGAFDKPIAHRSTE